MSTSVYNMAIAIIVLAAMMTIADARMFNSNNGVHMDRSTTTKAPDIDPRLFFKPGTKARDCQDLWDAGYRQKGVYTIYPNGTYGIKAYCEHTMSNTETVIQRRQFGNVSFVQPWSVYKRGFGQPGADYWMGLDAIYHLTYTGKMKLVIAIQDWAYNNQYVVYSHFSIGPESLRYRLTIGYAESSQISDDMSFANNMYFATYDRPDSWNCVQNMHAGWWYNYCAYTLLNGKYYYGGRYAPPGGYYDGMFWKDWGGYDYSMRYVRMSLVRK